MNSTTLLRLSYGGLILLMNEDYRLLRWVTQSRLSLVQWNSEFIEEVTRKEACSWNVKSSESLEKVLIKHHKGRKTRSNGTGKLPAHLKFYTAINTLNEFLQTVI